VNGLERAEAAGVDFQRIVNIEKRQGFSGR